MDVKAGDIVVISIKHQSKETQKVGLVLDVNTYTEANAPYPVKYTKHIKRIFGEEATRIRIESARMTDRNGKGGAANRPKGQTPPSQKGRDVSNRSTKTANKAKKR